MILRGEKQSMAKGNYFLAAVAAMGLFCPGLNATESTPGDRNLPIQQTYPPEAFYHNGKGGRVLDVTKPPFNAKGDGKTDDTKALCDAMRFVRDRCERLQGPGYSYCGKKENRNWVIYLPDGEYLISDTVCQGWPAEAINILEGWSKVQFVQVKSLEHVHAWARMVNNEHLPGAQYAFRRSNAWILGFKSENAETLFRAEDHYQLVVLGGSFLNWSPHKGPIIVCRDSKAYVVGLLWAWQVMAKTVLQNETHGIVTTLPATQFQKLGNVDGTVIVLLTPT